MNMKTTYTLLALCVLVAGTTFGQSTTTGTPSSTTGSTTTYNADSTRATTPTTNGDANNASGMSNSNRSTNTSATPLNSTYSTTSTGNSGLDRKTSKGYKGLTVGIYAGLNTTKFKGEALDANGSGNSKLTGRLGYQGGIFVRGGGRVFGQIGAEYFASSSDYFTAGSGTTATQIKDKINIQYIQVPVYIGYKLTESDRGISAVRVQVGVEYANRISTGSNSFNISNSEIKSGTFNGLGQLGFDAGPVFLDLTYHYGFSNSITQNTGFAGSARRILSASVGFKF